MTKPSITHVFNKFAGREVPMIEEQHTINLGGKDYKIDEVRFANPNDPLIQEMKKTAEDNGLQLRLWLPGSMGTMDFRTDRVNAHIEKSADGKYRVSSRFNLG